MDIITCLRAFALVFLLYKCLCISWKQIKKQKTNASVIVCAAIIAQQHRLCELSNHFQLFYHSTIYPLFSKAPLALIYVTHRKLRKPRTTNVIESADWRNMLGARCGGNLSVWLAGWLLGWHYEKLCALKAKVNRNAIKTIGK